VSANTPPHQPPTNRNNIIRDRQNAMSMGSSNEPFFIGFTQRRVMLASYPPRKPASGASDALGDKLPRSTGGVARYTIDPDPYPNLTWLNPSMVVGESLPDGSGAPLSLDPTTAELCTPSYFAASSSDFFCFILWKSTVYEHFPTIDFLSSTASRIRRRRMHRRCPT
jgi:hypothetical protein